MITGGAEKKGGINGYKEWGHLSIVDGEDDMVNILHFQQRARSLWAFECCIILCILGALRWDILRHALYYSRTIVSPS